jgi:hypothetical protein
MLAYDLRSQAIFLPNPAFTQHDELAEKGSFGAVSFLVLYMDRLLQEDCPILYRYFSDDASKMGWERRNSCRIHWTSSPYLSESFS